MRLAIAGGVAPNRFAEGSAAALRFLDAGVTRDSAGKVLRSLWSDIPDTQAEADLVIGLIEEKME